MAKPGILVTGGTGLATEQLGHEPDYPLDKVLADYAVTLQRLEIL